MKGSGYVNSGAHRNTCSNLGGDADHRLFPAFLKDNRSGNGLLGIGLMSLSAFLVSYCEMIFTILFQFEKGAYVSVSHPINLV